MPLPLRVLAHVGSAPRSDLAREDRPKTVDPEPDTFMADIDAALMKQVFDIP